MLAIHPNARTTPAVRAEIARSSEPSGVLARRFGVSTETVRKWRKRGPTECRDRSSRPRKLPWKASEEERAVVCALRRATGFPLDDLTFMVSHFLPHLNRDTAYRILKAAGLGSLPPADPPRRPVGSFKKYEAATRVGRPAEIAISGRECDPHGCRGRLGSEGADERLRVISATTMPPI